MIAVSIGELLTYLCNHGWVAKALCVTEVNNFRVCESLETDELLNLQEGAFAVKI